jgi:hypothetical protein
MTIVLRRYNLQPFQGFVGRIILDESLKTRPIMSIYRLTIYTFMQYNIAILEQRKGLNMPQRT